MDATSNEPFESLSSAQSPRQTPGPAGLIEYREGLEPMQFLNALREEYGDVVRYQSRFGPCFLFAHPEHVQAIFLSQNYRRASLVKMILGEGLLASDGPLWRSQRQLMQRDFQPRCVAPFVSVMLRETERTASEWRRAAVSGADVDVAGSMTRLTLQIIVAALFSSDLSDEESADLCAAVTRVVNALGRISWTIFGAPMNFTPAGTAEFAAAKTLIDRVCADMIARRRRLAVEQRPRDLLTLLIEAVADTGTLDERQLRDEMVTMLIGGHETTALALAWTWKLLAEHPQVDTKLRQEVDAVVTGDAAATISFAGLAWTRAVLKETMRLYPPVWHVARVAMDEGVIGGYAIPRGACVLISAWITHRHDSFWDDPERFNPERFANANQPHHPDAYLPFGGGRHTCLGMHFALLEGTLILGLLSRRFRLHPINAGEIRANPGVTLRQSPGLRARVELRRDVEARHI
jgi:cytochrome P450